MVPMFHGLKMNKALSPLPWQPTASLELLRKRAQIIDQVRAFFAKRNILEVETPLLARSGVTEPFIVSIPAEFILLGETRGETCYLQTSPEYAMKRLLAAGSGPIYQICKAFRNGEIGRHHNPEFSMLEWYRPGFDLELLMAEVTELIQLILPNTTLQYYTYQAIFEKILQLNPHAATVPELQACLQREQIEGVVSDDKDTLLQVLMSHVIEPRLPFDTCVFIYHFPATQAALARINKEGPLPVAERFEVYGGGLELANGFYELTDAKEQAGRFQADLIKRKQLNLPAVPVDHYLLAALEHGLPDCSGVALGIDRLVMLALGVDQINDILSFGFAVI